MTHFHVQTLFFGISADASGRSLLEEYIFNFDFADGGARLDLTTDGKKFSSSKAVAGQVNDSVSHAAMSCSSWAWPEESRCTVADVLAQRWIKQPTLTHCF